MPCRVPRKMRGSGKSALTEDLAGHRWVIVRGLVALILGMTVLFPSADAATTRLTLLTGASALVFGAFVIVVGFRLRPNAPLIPPTTSARHPA